MRLARDMATSPMRTPRANSSASGTFADLVRASLGPTMTDRFYAPYVEKLFGIPADQLAGELARRRIGASSARALVRRVVRPDPERGIFYYPRRGYGQISEAIAAAATQAGADIRTATEVAAIRATDAGVEIDTADGSTLSAGACWSTLPLPLLARIASAPPEIEAAGITRSRHARCSSSTSRSRAANGRRTTRTTSPRPTCS